MKYSTYYQIIKDNRKKIQRLNINLVIFLYSLFIIILYKSKVSGLTLFLTSNSSEILTRVIFLGIIVLFLLSFNIILLQSFDTNKNNLDYSRVGSIFLTSAVFPSTYILISNPDLSGKFAMIALIISIVYLIYLFSEIKDVFKINFNKKIFPFIKSAHIRIISYSIIIIYFCYFSFLSVITFLTFESPTHDTGIFINILHNIARFHPPMVSIYDMNFFEHHFSPILYLLIPFYWLFPSPITILILQSLALALSSIFIFKLGKHFFKDELLAVLLQASFLLHPIVHGTNLFDFHEVAFLPLFLLGAFYYYEIKAVKKYWLFIILTLLVKEDAPIYVAVYGAYIILMRDNKKTGIYTFIISVAYYLSIKPLLVHGVLFSRYAELMIPGVSPEKGIILTLISNPLYILDLIFSNSKKISFIIIAFLPLLYLPFRSGYAIILLAPPVIYGLLTNYEMHFRIDVHNPLPFIPVLYYLAIIAISKLKENTTYIGIFIFISSISVNFIFGSLSPTLKPITEKLDKKIKREVINSAIALIPKNASVSTNVQIVPNLSMRDSIFTFPFLLLAETNGKLSNEEGKKLKYSLSNEATYILWDNKYSWTWPLASRDQGFKLIQQLAFSGKYGLLYSNGGIYLLKKNYSTSKNPELNRYYSICLPREFGQEIPEKESGTGYVLFAQPSDVSNGPKYVTWGPYTTLPAGKHEIDFWLKTDNNSGDEEIASIEVYKDPGNYLATKDIKASDFINPGKFQLFRLSIENVEEIENIEFRILYKGKRNLWVDYILPREVN